MKLCGGKGERKDIQKVWQHQHINRATYKHHVLTCVLPVKRDPAESLMPHSNYVMPFAVTVLFTIIISGGHFH